ncbi:MULTISPECIES: aspartyl-phosphate phosphatase Spo0E family protein [Bacillaceae]|uniref:aspartyl-phosphate phosphatase Spo0E family protein n=1 Tax=Bacillaceae TaxID=186817 RepID=UPI001E41C74F|nr:MULTISPECIES: aspartyl-phosphate phosphatase Spo0E family protein [Bacillaceae]MCE4047943.1 aspartyl-phosphate phosphatase Spo0E family protein [Bacillus sp. Au-Bac7]MCM3032475.1 aspartyl-phosphate phosphatase Spo0E family protein [Niallia sp. MER 6]MDL0436381.1 aspartyl-phosphate phosphatase Spo0E family protein [Niallia sp. SS-2023]UPO89221.1 aspartyl-phosphate phosphatase Spo0E family protein [Niallia sp. Man26]
MSNQQLVYLIEIKRQKLVEAAKEHGFASPIVISCSQELDILINKLMETTANPKKVSK